MWCRMMLCGGRQLRSSMWMGYVLQDVPILVADASDKQSLEHLTKSTKVVLATAGPFAVLGTPIVEACVATSTNYCDITGEKEDQLLGTTPDPNN